MSSRQMNARYMHNDTTANWLANGTTVLLKGEIAIETLTTGEHKIKIGNGVDSWSSLPYFESGLPILSGGG